MFKKLLQYLLFSALSFLVFLLLVFVIAVITMGPSVKENSVLVLNLEGRIFEEGPQGIVEKFFLGDVVTVRDIITSLKKARNDDRIKALIVTTLNTEMGPGKAQEIRAAIKDFQKSGKPTYGFIEDGDLLEYYVCAAAKKLYVVPGGEGGVNLLGVRAEVPFFKGTLDKLGIVAQLDHIGPYKNASDIWTRDSMSEAHREATNSILDSLYSRILQDLSEDRKIPIEELKTLMDRGPLTRQEIRNTKLVDRLLYRDEMDSIIEKDTKTPSIQRISVKEYKEPTFGELISGARNKIGIVYATGAIVTGESQKGTYEDTMGSTTITEAIRQARDDDTVKAIVMRVDSPGGSAVASDLIWREVIVARKKKPVIVSMSDVAASGGYYISMGATSILSNPSTFTGSIGVIYGKFYMKGLYEKIGLNKEIIKRGEHADLFSDYVPFQEEEWQIIKKHMKAIYDTFTEKAAQGRKKTQQQIDEIGQGRVWTGEQALRLGLIDKLGGLSDAIEEARKAAKIPEKEEVGFAIYPQRKGRLGDLVLETHTFLELPQEISTVLRLARMTERENFLLLMPYRFIVE